MGQNPFYLAAKAAHAELSSETAKQFFQDTALQHIGLTVFYLFETMFYIVEAGKMTRTLVESWRTTETVSTEPDTMPEVEVAGLLLPATEGPPLTTDTAVSNPQKLEQHIITVIKGIYDDNIQDSQSDHSGDRQDSSPHDSQGLELVYEPIPTQTESHSQTDPVVAPRKRKPRATSGNPGKTDDPKTKGRVPRSRRQVSTQ